MAFIGFFAATSAFGVTQYRRDNLTFIKNPAELRTSLSLPTNEQKVEVKIPVSKLRTRAFKAVKNEKIEPLTIFVPREQGAFDKFVKNIARSSSAAKKLNQILTKKLAELGPTDATKFKVVVGPQEFALMRTGELAIELEKPHLRVTVDGEELQKNAALRVQLINQIEPFLGAERTEDLDTKIKRGEDLLLDRDLLTPFARKMVGKFLVFRGPNCFHAALAFHSQKMTRSPLVNVKEEQGYHRAMINYDELWRAINRNFYRVDPQASQLKYGDMVVFFDVPDNPGPEVNFRWIRHTATYLFGPYTFSKGSKSPDTPYTVKTLADEWNTWRGFSKNLGVQIYRRNSTTLRTNPPGDVTDWIY